MRHCSCFAIASSLLLGLLSGVEAAEPANLEGVQYFETYIRPLLAKHCYDCHSALYAENKLELDSYEGVMNGGKRGPVIVPGKPKKSLMLRAVGYEDPELQMPPLMKLPDKKIARLRAWIAMGAPYPHSSKPAAMEGPAVPGSSALNWEQARQFWSFQPIADPEAPPVKHSAWCRGAIDQFILAKLEKNGLEPSPPASKRTLIRRATYDLTGLPPTRAEIKTFLADDSPGAFARLVDRLLASPAYGERWGRHWLDVARYANSNGLDENVAFGNAWRYRDYVVESFNEDKPYNKFVLEQLAGDLLPASGYRERNEQLIATGFLSLGAKFLAEVDKKKMRMDIIDEQIDTTGKAFLGMTFGCARCHDHKFDPILTADYYALAGIFKSTQTMATLKTVAMWHENPIPTPADLAAKAAYEKKVAAQNETIAAFINDANAALLATLADGAALPKKPETKYPPKTKKTLKKLRQQLKAIKKAAPQMPMAMGVTEGEATNVAIHIRGSHLRLGKVVPRRLPLVFVSTAEQPDWTDEASGRLALARWIASPENPLTARVMANRIWRWHFGKGIVTTTDNFGTRGDKPSHPELLDWLASRFIAGGWSIKDLHRTIMLSATYRMSSAYRPTAAKIDPANSLLWRMPIRRLEAEEIRDTLLAVSDRLNRQVGGSVLHVGNHEYLFNHTSMDIMVYDAARRSLYVPVIRNHLYAPFRLFDYASAAVVTGNRPTSTVAPQALFFLNSKLVMNAATAIAEDVLARDSAGDAARIKRLYHQVLRRPAESHEVKRALDYLDRLTAAFRTSKSQDARRAAWEALCQTLLASNEFIYIR